MGCTHDHCNRRYSDAFLCVYYKQESVELDAPLDEKSKPLEVCRPDFLVILSTVGIGSSWIHRILWLALLSWSNGTNLRLTLGSVRNR